MERNALQSLVYGGITELVRNKRYYYQSSIGPEYSHLTDEGKEAVLEFMNLMAGKIKETDEADLNQRAKDMVMKELKS